MQIAYSLDGRRVTPGDRTIFAHKNHYHNFAGINSKRVHTSALEINCSLLCEAGAGQQAYQHEPKQQFAERSFPSGVL